MASLVKTLENNTQQIIIGNHLGNKIGDAGGLEGLVDGGFDFPMNFDNELHVFNDNPRTDALTEEFSAAAAMFSHGAMFMDTFDKDTHVQGCSKNIFYPFASRDEWEMASFLLQSQLSMVSINKFLSLKLVYSLHVHHAWTEVSHS